MASRAGCPRRKLVHLGSKLVHPSCCAVPCNHKVSADLQAELSLHPLPQADVAESQLNALPNFLVYRQEYQQTLPEWWQSVGDPAWVDGLVEFLSAQLQTWHAAGKVHGALRPEDILIDSAGKPRFAGKQALASEADLLSVQAADLFAADLQALIRCAEQLWRAVPGTWPEPSEPGFQHEPARHAILQANYADTESWLLAVRSLPNRRLAWQAQQKAIRQRRRHVWLAVATVVVLLGLFGAFQAGQASYQAQRANTWGERLAVHTVHDVATAGQTAVALALAQQMQQELTADNQQQATLAATMRTIAELAAERFDWPTADEAWLATAEMAPEWQAEAARGRFHLAWAQHASERQPERLLAQRPLLTDVLFHQYASESFAGISISVRLIMRGQKPAASRAVVVSNVAGWFPVVGPTTPCGVDRCR